MSTTYSKPVNATEEQKEQKQSAKKLFINAPIKLKSQKY
jgi:hypothetical protein